MKIDRDAIMDALESPHETSDVILQAAQILLEITAPDYVPSDEMEEAGEILDAEFYNVASFKDIFRVMIRELCK